MLNALWSFICPPLFLDWEMLHKSSGFKMPIKNCFRRSMAFFTCHNILIFVETILFSIPVFVSKNHIDKYPQWDRYFTWIVGLQVKLLIANVIVIPPTLGGMAYIYFVVKGHPWARILKMEMAQDHKEQLAEYHPKNLIRIASQDLTSSGTRCKNLTRSKSCLI